MWIPININPPPQNTEVIVRGGDREDYKYGFAFYGESGFKTVNVHSICYGPRGIHFDFTATHWMAREHIE